MLKNDIGSDIVWGYLDVGHYTASSIAGKFFVDKTVVFIQLGQTPGFVTAYTVDTDTVDGPHDSEPGVVVAFQYERPFLYFKRTSYVLVRVGRFPRNRRL